MTSSTFTNRLARESSPYLRQHAHNPVDWFPWGPEALERARKLDRPIFLSIGYSACHWCHVMNAVQMMSGILDWSNSDPTSSEGRFSR